MKLQGTIVMTRMFDCESDPRPGGVFRMRWRAPWGGAYRVNGEYREVVAPDRLVIARAASMVAGMQKGWAQTVDRLGVLLGPKPHKEM